MGPGGPAEPRGGVGYADLHALSASEREQALQVVGIPQQVSSSGTLDAFPITSRWLDALSEDLAFGRLDQWAERVAQDEDFQALIYRSAVQANMGGQMFVRAVEVPETAPVLTRALAAVVPGAFLSLPFDEAIRAFLGRRLVTPEQYRQMSADARAQAFSAARMTSEVLVGRVRELLGETLEEGGDYRSFVERVRDGELDLGITPTAPGYLETIFRTNVQSAYGAGRLEQIRNPLVMAARPFVEYRTARDSRVRPDHAELDGVVFRQDDPGWETYSPPLGYNCRCTVVTRKTDQVDLTRVVPSSSIRVRPTPGFGGRQTT